MASIFSLEINEQYTRLANLNYKKGSVELVSLGYDQTIPNFYSNPTDRLAADQAKVLSNLYKQLNLEAKQANVIIPDSKTYSQLLVMPELKEEELVNSIRLQADEFIPLPIEDVYIDLDIVAKLPDSKLLILFVAAPKKIVDHISNTITLAGFEPYTLENELSAIGRFVSEVYPFAKEPSLIVNFASGGSSIYFINPPFPYFQITRSTHIGLDILLRDLSVNLNLKDKQAIEAMQNIGLKPGGSINIYPIIYPIISELLTEIEKTMLLAKEKYNAVIKNIYLYNLNAQVAGINEAIQNKLNIPTQSFPIGPLLVSNAVSQSFAPVLPSFISVIAGHIR
ncbi:hypothetical protein BH09PAT2_BH09PAT2_09470 [soil metagenome]